MEFWIFTTEKKTRRFSFYRKASGSYDTAVQAAEGLARNAGMVVSVNTIRRVLKESGLHSAQKIKKPMLSIRHRNARMEFAVRHKD